MVRGLIGFGDRVQVDGEYGTAEVSTDSNGDGSTTVNFEKEFKEAPIVIPARQTEDDSGICSPANITADSADLTVDNSSVTDGTVTVGYVALADQKQ